jgi:regulator of sigma E protease
MNNNAVTIPLGKLFVKTGGLFRALFSDTLSRMNIIVFVLVLMVIVLVHEFGHFIVAKKNGIRVDEFGFGFPPKLFGKKFGETEYTFNLLPLGGFVKIFGETPDDDSISGEDSKRSLVNKPRHVQAAVMAAGITFNFLLAWVLFIAIFAIGAPYSDATPVPNGGVLENTKLTIMYVAPLSPAETAGLKMGDTIAGISSKTNSESVEKPTVLQVQTFVTKYAKEGVTVSYQRGKNSSLEKVSAIPKLDEKGERYLLGIQMDNVGTLKLPLMGAVIEGTKTMISMTQDVAVGLYDFFKTVFVGKAKFSDVSGPVGMVGLAGDAAKVGFVSVLILTALISVNLGLMNLLPFPALDGGRIFFLLIESIKRSPINPKIANRLNYAGFAFLLALMAIVTYHDVLKLF